MCMCWLKIQVNELRSIKRFDGNGGKGTEKEVVKGGRYKIISGLDQQFKIYLKNKPSNYVKFIPEAKCFR